MEAAQKRKTILWVVAALVVILAAVSIYMWKAGDNTSETGALSVDDVTGKNADKATEPVKGSSPLVVVYGVDRYEDTSYPEAIAVLGVDQRNSDSVVVSLLPDQTLDNGDIRSRYILKGPDDVTSGIARLLDIPLSDYVVVNYDVFETIVDKLGGVTLDVEEDVHVKRSETRPEVTIRKGTQVLDGTHALAYVRYKLTDIDTYRLQRHIDFLNALKKKITAQDSIVKIPVIVKDIFSLVKTNISLKNAVGLVESFDFKQAEGISMVVIREEKVSAGTQSVRYMTPDEFAKSGPKI